MIEKRKITDDHAVELFRLRYTLRRATETGQMGRAARYALQRMRELGEGRGRGHLLFEHRRWQVQLGGQDSARA